MSIEETIRILDPETSADTIAEIKYYAGFNKDKTIEKVNEACEVACGVMKKYLEREKRKLILKKRKIQYCDNGEYYHNYFVEGEHNPCGCGSNVYHFEYDGKKIYGVCNACKMDIYEYQDEYIEEKLKEGIWK